MNPDSSNSRAHAQSALAAFDHAPDGLLLVDRNGRIMTANTAAEVLFGYDGGSLAGRLVDELVPPTHMARHVAGRTAFFANSPGTVAVGLSASGKRRDGSVFPVEISLRACQHGGEPAAVCTLRRPGESQAANRALHEAEELLRTAIEQTGQVVYDLDVASGRIKWAGALARVLGDSPADADLLDVKAWEARIHPDERERAARELDACIAAGKPYDIEYRYQHRSGRWLRVYDHGVFLRNEKGEVFRMIGAMADVTERQGLEDQLRQAQKMESVGRLAGGVAHDFNNLLTAILGYSEIAFTRAAADPKLQDYIQHIRKAAERGAGLTQQLLAFARKQVIEPRVLDVNVQIRGIEKLLQRLIGEDIELLVVPAPAALTVRVDPGQLEQVLMNLAVNARDAMPNGGKMTIETGLLALSAEYAALHPGTPAGEYVAVSVSDTGHGIPPEIMDKLFEPFFTTKGQGKGTGLGLATCYGIVKHAGGHIGVYSEPGRGTTFRVYLPVVHEATTLVPKAADARVKGGNEHILLVEDDPGVRELSASTLLQLGYRVTTARDGAEALETAAAKGPFDLLITDVVMPRMGGRAMAQALEGRQPGLRVLYVSGYTENAIVHHGVLEQGLNFLQKPFTASAMAQKVREVLDQPM